MYPQLQDLICTYLRRCVNTRPSKNVQYLQGSPWRSPDNNVWIAWLLTCGTLLHQNYCYLWTKGAKLCTLALLPTLRSKPSRLTYGSLSSELLMSLHMSDTIQIQVSHICYKIIICLRVVIASGVNCTLWLTRSVSFVVPEMQDISSTAHASEMQSRQKGWRQLRMANCCSLVFQTTLLHLTHFSWLLKHKDLCSLRCVASCGCKTPLLQCCTAGSWDTTSCQKTRNSFYWWSEESCVAEGAPLDIILCQNLSHWCMIKCCFLAVC